MSEDKPESETQDNEGISDDQLPPDVRPEEDNPLTVSAVGTALTGSGFANIFRAKDRAQISGSVGM